ASANSAAGGNGTRQASTTSTAGGVGRFVLGQYARQMTDAQKLVYRPLFRRFATNIYQNVLADYAGETLSVAGSVDRSARDVIVNSKVDGGGANGQYRNLVVHWRVYRSRDGAQSVVDAGADGIWLAIEQQSQFKSVIANNGGGECGIDALIKNLQKRVSG
ncbi:MAG: ABC transporter substrate-binding protein, partial [Pseudomonadota bacterium]